MKYWVPTSKPMKYETKGRVPKCREKGFVMTHGIRMSRTCNAWNRGIHGAGNYDFVVGK